MGLYATFTLDQRVFGQTIPMIREIIRSCAITPVPHAPPHVRGLINLRGQVVTILDLAVRLGMPRRATDERSHILILKTDAELASMQARGEGRGLQGSADVVGFLVDTLGDVVEADESKIEPPSANVTEAEGRFLSGVIQTDSGLLVLLNIRTVLADDQE
jgi:purine-binding chemotaxis protein CheW